jgi:adenylylsulfate kinase
LREDGGGLAIWLTGLPASGKTALAQALAPRLAARGHEVEVLDTDALREVLTPRPAYTAEERDWFYAVLVFLAGMLARHGITVLLAATANRRAYRDAGRRALARFAEVHVRCPIETCRARDPKGLYARAGAGEVRTLPGAQETYEPPERPEAAVDTDRLSPEEAAASVLGQLEARGLI